MGCPARPTALSCMLGPTSPSSRRGPGTGRSHTKQTSGSMKGNSSPPANSTPQPRCTTPTERKPVFDYRSMFDLSGKTALVVGAGSGIGEASAQGLAAFGASVVCADVDKEAAEDTATGGFAPKFDPAPQLQSLHLNYKRLLREIPLPAGAPAATSPN